MEYENKSLLIYSIRNLSKNDFQDILTKLNEIPPEKPGIKRLESRSSAGVQPTISSSENEWITDEFLTEFARQRVCFSSTKVNHLFVYFDFRRN